MAIVPIQEGPQVKAAPLDTTPYQAAQFGGVAEGVSKGLETLGETGGQAAVALDDIQKTKEEADTKNIDNQYLTKVLPIKAHFTTLAGQNALDAQADTTKQIQGTVSDLMGQATTPRMKVMTADILNRRMANDLGDIQQHADGQEQVYQVDQSTGRQALSTDAAQQSAFNPVEADRNIATVRDEIANTGRLKGQPAEFVQAQQNEAESKIRLNIIQQLAQTGEQGPAVAAAYLDKYKDQMPGEQGVAAQTYIKTHQDSIDADARRVAAEALATVNRAKAEARSTAEAGIARINLGPIPPDDLANVITSAQQSGDAGLIQRVGIAAQKQQTQQVYKNLTPAELQPHINEISAQVTQAGDKANPADIVALNTMREMQASSGAQIKADPLSWAATHAGVDPGTINWNDPSTISHRIGAAARASSITGQPPQYLTQAEAASFAPTWTNGTAEQRVGLVTQLSKLGPGAVSAAQQVAGNDPMLAHVVGLASLPDKAVAASIIHATLNGPDAIKAHKDIVNDTQMQQSYDTTVAGALRLMPDASAGTMATAKNYFAGKMTAQGVLTYAQGARSFPNAISTALGGYNDHGVMRGGIGTSNGAATVLPTGASQQDFDAKIARAGVAAFQHAGNGQPVWSNGEGVTVGQIKKAQFVPVGDGRYALFANGNLVQTKGGARYVLDWRAITDALIPKGAPPFHAVFGDR